MIIKKTYGLNNLVNENHVIIYVNYFQRFISLS